MTPLAPSPPGIPSSRPRRSVAVDGPWTTVRDAGWCWRLPPGVSIKFRNGFRDWLVDGEPNPELLDSVAKRGLHRTTWRLRLGEIPCYLKLSHSRSWTGWLRGQLQGRPAEREFRKLQLLAEAGLPVTPPLAVGSPAGLLGSRSWLLTADVPGRSLDELAPPERRPDAPWLSREERAGLTRALIRLLVRLHAAGFCHRDLHAGNLLWAPGGDDGSMPQLTLVDVAAIEPCMGGISEAQRWRDLSQLRHAFCLAASRSDQMRLARSYLHEALLISPGQNRKRYRRTIRKLAAQSTAYSRAAWEKADRKWSRGNRRVAIVRNEWIEVRGLSSLGSPLLERLAAAASDPAAESPVGWRWMEFSRARCVWELGHALLRRGIRAAEPLVLITSASNQSGWIAFVEPNAADIVCRAGRSDVERLLVKLRQLGFAASSEWCDKYGEIADGLLRLSPCGLAWLAEAAVMDVPPRSMARAA